MGRGLRAGWYDTLAGWLDSKGYKRKIDEPCAFINDKGFTILWKNTPLDS